MKKRNKYYLRDKEYIRLKKDLRQNWETQRELGGSNYQNLNLSDGLQNLNHVLIFKIVKMLGYSGLFAKTSAQYLLLKS